MNTLLLVGGDLCQRTAALLDPAAWRCIGLRRRRMRQSPSDAIFWHEGDLRDPASMAFLREETFSTITHVLYAPSPDSRQEKNYADVYSEGFVRFVNSLAPQCREQLRRCVLVGSSVVWSPTEAWVDEDTPADAPGFRSEAILTAEAAMRHSFAPEVGVALRLSGLYGPGRLRLLQGLRAGSVIAPAGPGHWANRIHIDDAARACAHLLSLSQPHPLYIGSDDHPMPTIELYDSLGRLLDGPMPTREWRAPSGKRLSNRRLRASGWAPHWPNAIQGYAASLADAGS